MLKPKNISIKKVTDPQNIADDKKNRNSRQSLKITIRQLSHSNKHSPIDIMKFDTNEDESEPDHGNFIKYINGYLNQLDSNKVETRSRNTKDLCQIERLRKKINKEKQINREMQRNIVQFQRILLQRTEKLDLLEQHVRNIEAKEKAKDKQNLRNLCNINSHSKSRQKLIHKKIGLQQISSEFEHGPSDISEQISAQEIYPKYRQRRKTQMPSQIERAISKTIALKPQKYIRQKY